METNYHLITTGPEYICVAMKRESKVKITRAGNINDDSDFRAINLVWEAKIELIYNERHPQWNKSEEIVANAE